MQIHQIDTRHLDGIKSHHAAANSFHFNKHETLKRRRYKRRNPFQHILSHAHSEDFRSFFLWSRTKFKFDGFQQASSRFFGAFSDCSRQKRVKGGLEYEQRLVVTVSVDICDCICRGQAASSPPTQTVSAGPELIPTYNWNQNERKNPQKVATAPAAASRQSRLIFWSSYAAGAERCSGGRGDLSLISGAQFGAGMELSRSLKIHKHREGPY